MEAFIKRVERSLTNLVYKYTNVQSQHTSMHKKRILRCWDLLYICRDHYDTFVISDDMYSESAQASYISVYEAKQNIIRTLGNDLLL
jgi:hypothetical protein